MITLTTMTEDGRMVQAFRPQYMINAVRDKDGTLRVPNRVVDGQRVNTYIREIARIGLASATASAASGKAEEAVKEETKTEEATKAEAVKG